ncbi:hypothetical protein WOLCODRAFT_29498 [Wolfiporia cocos MD-104 SS10]|uniref:Uncharacterized protein n=1 Tax=Wolfiporia cocos (strain MD-104) TaxID=742152 RepID=A0A2H3JAU9_WOLCO|nr:hypothetical protein WOLCODRAFT_29498 [Wolfiporia cocos MD-104 SS10]
MSIPAPEHGLVHDPAFLAALPVLTDRPPPHAPVRRLTAQQFKDVHLKYATSHAPDGVLFPFLHGLEGDNAAQNTFFAADPRAHVVPRFRGLVWVAADDGAGRHEGLLHDAEDDDEDDEDDDGFSDASSLESLGTMDIDTPATPATGMELDPAIAPGLDADLGQAAYTKTPPPAHAYPPLVPPARTAALPAVLTSSFRARELLQNAGAGRAFVEPRVPEGISLRNFGIQVPIFATLSDIVVYSPRGNVRAAHALAEQLKDAVERKRADRSARYPDSADSLLAYNVFVLDASPAEVHAAVPHLVTRIEDVPLAHTDGTDAHTEGEADSAPVSDFDIQLRLLRANTVDFARREKEEMRDLTQASEIITVADPAAHPAEALDPEILSGSTTATRWDPSFGQIFLGNSNDVPLPPDRRLRARRHRAYGEEDDEDDDSAFDWSTNDPAHGLGYDICIECHDFAPFPTAAHVRAAEEHLGSLERRWVERCVRDTASMSEEEAERTFVPPRPPPGAAAVIHLPFPSSPPSTVGTANTLLPFLNFLESLLHPPPPMSIAAARAQVSPPPASPVCPPPAGAGFMPSSLPPPSAFPSSFFPSGAPAPQNTYTRTRSTSATFLPSSSSSSSSSYSSSSSGSSSPSSRSYTSSAQTSHTSASVHADTDCVEMRTRPSKMLIYSADGYTESSVLALALLMTLRRVALPQAYLLLQCEKRRSFFVYPVDLPVLRRIEVRLERERERERGLGIDRKGRGVVVGLGREREDEKEREKEGAETSDAMALVNAFEKQHEQWTRPRLATRPSAKSVSFAVPPARAPPPPPVNMPPSRTQSENDSETLHLEVAPGSGRPRASTLPASVAPPPSIHDHEVWFTDPRFDGSFPSRVLPFLYLGNLNHASNAYMLHALGITHVVSVGECALVPPPSLEASASAPSCAGAAASARARAAHGSLFVEEREGRIRVLDIKGVCDDGIDTLEPQLAPICDWIDAAREAGGKVLVHCRVGVSRSATVTIAYVMKHLNLPLVDAYLIVRSRRLSVLIQPNMRLLYNLLGWEVQLARERAGGDDDRLRAELARSLNWPCLAREVHALNEKYLH